MADAQISCRTLLWVSPFPPFVGVPFSSAFSALFPPFFGSKTAPPPQSYFLRPGNDSGNRRFLLATVAPTDRMQGVGEGKIDAR